MCRVSVRGRQLEDVSAQQMYRLMQANHVNVAQVAQVAAANKQTQQNVRMPTD